MFIAGNEKFASTRHYYSQVMRLYFRRNPPIPSNVYLSGEVMENESLRIQVAQNCQFPAILNHLANDENERVRTAARQTRFWRLVGHYQDILGFGKRERRAFARIEGHPNILVLLMFEDDPDVINEVLHNPTVSLNILVLFQQLLAERGAGRKDEQLQMIARAIINERREQIIKIAEINKAAENILLTDNIRTILHYLTQKDITINRAIANILNAEKAETLRAFVYFALDEKAFEHGLDQFVALSALINLIAKREDQKRIPVSALKLDKKEKPRGNYQSVADFLLGLLTKKRLSVVKKSVANITDFKNIVLLTHCHIEKDKQLSKLAADIMPLDDILNLVNDVSTPRKIFKVVLGLLENHPDETVVERVHDTYLLETSRMRDSLKELELTVQAYFDIIFQSLGYNNINAYLNVVRTIKSTEKQMAKFDNLLKEELGNKREELDTLLDRVKHVLSNKANLIYFDTGAEVNRELESIFGIIEDVFKLKEMGLTSLRPGTPQDIESEIRVRGRVIWQSAISAYLGRIKDLSEMIKKKILVAAADYVQKEELEAEMADAAKELESSHKIKVQCPFNHTCKVCGKRGCASERFLQETHFFIKEYLDNFVD